MCDFTNSVFSPVWPGLTCIAGCCLLAAGCLGGVQQTIWASWVTGKLSVENVVFFRETATILLWVVQLSSLWMLLNLLKNKKHDYPELISHAACVWFWMIYAESSTGSRAAFVSCVHTGRVLQQHQRSQKQYLNNIWRKNCWRHKVGGICNRLYSTSKRPVE